MHKREVQKKIRRLKELRQRTGVGPTRLLKGRTDIPDGLTVSRVDRLFRGDATNLTSIEFRYMLKLYTRLADKEERLKINAMWIERLREQRERTGISPAKLLEAQQDIPASLTARRLSDFLGGRIAHFDKEEFRYALKLYKKLPDAPGRIKLTDEIIATLNYHKQRTGVGPSALISGKRHEMPAGLNTGQIRAWMNRKIRSAEVSCLNYVLKAWKALPDEDDSYVAFDEALQNTIRAKLKATRFSPRGLLMDRDDLPKDLTPNMIVSWCTPTSTIKRIKREHYDFFIKLCDEIKKSEKPVDFASSAAGQVKTGKSAQSGNKRSLRARYVDIDTPEYLGRLQKEIERTGLKVGRVLKHAPEHPHKPSAGMASGWANGYTKTAEPDKFNLLLSLYSQLPDQDKRKEQAMKNDKRPPVSDFLNEDALKALWTTMPTIKAIKRIQNVVDKMRKEDTDLLFIHAALKKVLADLEQDLQEALNETKENDQVK